MVEEMAARDERDPTRITRAELEVLVRIADGEGLKKIARELGITRESVRDRYRRARRKIQHEVAWLRGYDTGR